MNITVLSLDGGIENIIDATDLATAQQFYPNCRITLPTDSMPDGEIQQSVPITADAGWIIYVLHEMGLYDNVAAYVATQPIGVMALWNRASTFQNNNAIIRSWAAANGKTQTDIDAIFNAANTAAAASN